MVSKAGAGRATGASASQDNRAGSAGACGWQGRRLGSRSCWRVAWSPRTRGSLRRARRAAESSPRRAKWTALSARCSAPGSDTEARAGGEAVEASRRQLKETGYATRPNAWLGGVGLARAWGGDREVGQGCCNTSVAQNASRLTNAARSRASASAVSWTVLVAGSARGRKQGPGAAQVRLEGWRRRGPGRQLQKVRKSCG